MSRFGLREKLLALFTTLFLVVVANYLIVVQTQQKAREKYSRVEHTHNVIFKSESLFGNLKDAETGQRGYLLTHTPDYLNPYHQGVEEATRQILLLQELTSDNPEQQEALRSIAQLMQEKFAELALTIEVANSGDNQRALEIVRGHSGKQLMDKIRTELEAFQAEEKRLLVLRYDALDNLRSRLVMIFMIEVVIWLLTVFVVHRYIKKKLADPLLKMEGELKQVESGKENINLDTTQNDEVGSLARALTSMHMALKSRTQELENLSAELETERDKALYMSSTDMLTGLFNRRKFEEIGELELKRARREKHLLNLIILDLDFFKSVNDVYGHNYGDRVLADIARTLENTARRPNDFVFRLGGEEFVFLTSGLSEAEASSLAGSIVKSVEALCIPNKRNEASEYVTLSAGVVSIIPMDDQSIYDFLNYADQGLYRAKNAGRNNAMPSDKSCPSFNSGY